MRSITRIIEYSSRADEFTIHPLADIHFGAAACDEKRFSERLDEIDADPLALWLMLGDQLDCIGHKDPRFDISSLPRWLVLRWHESGKLGLAQHQRNELAERINAHETLGDKLLAVVEGNHEAMIRKHQDIDAYLSLIERLHRGSAERLALGVSGFVTLRFRRTVGENETRAGTFSVVIYLHHGWGGGDLAGGINLKLERQMDRYGADVYLMGHHHKVTTHTNPGVIRPNSAGRIEQGADRLGAVCAPFLRCLVDGSDTYSEAKAYRAAPANADILVRVRPDKHEVDLVERSRREAVIL